jgi:purine-binding chemotaxis protein CheW
VTITPLPKAPAVVEGAINLRGTVVPVLDIRARFRRPPKPAEHTDHLVVAQAGAQLVALRVDRALDLLPLDGAAVDNAEAVLPGVEYVARVARLPDGLVLIHDLNTFLTAAEADALTAALPTAPGPEDYAP